MIPADRKYSKEHEWVRMDGDVATVGITDFAQNQLTDIVFVELPEVGRKVSPSDAAAVLESVKSVSDVFSPVEGEVSEVNRELEAHPEYVNESPYDTGWIFKVKTSGGAMAELMDAEAYQAYVDQQEH